MARTVGLPIVALVNGDATAGSTSEASYDDPLCRQRLAARTIAGTSRALLRQCRLVIADLVLEGRDRVPPSCGTDWLVAPGH